MARRLKPTALKKAEGNLGGRPMPKNEINPDSIDLAVPERLELGPIPERSEQAALAEHAERFWNTFVPELKRQGLATIIDAPALEEMCQCYSRMQVATEIVKREGMIYEQTNKFGQTLKFQHHGLFIIERERNALRKFFCEFGMTPSARAGWESRVALGAGGDDVDISSGPAKIEDVG